MQSSNILFLQRIFAYGRRACVAIPLILAAGCSPTAEIRQYKVEAEEAEVVTSDVLRGEFGSIPFQWTAPKSWELGENDQFSKIAWEVGTKSDRARVTVSAVSMGMGLVAQLARWRGQIELKLPEGASPMEGTEPLKLGDISATYVDFHGPEQSILGMMFQHENKLWVFKFRGSNEMAKEQQERFRKFCESVNVPTT